MIKNRSAKERLLNNTHKLFAEKAFDEVSVRDLASCAEVNVSTIFYHFGGKDGLVLAIVERFISDNISSIMSRLSPNVDSEVSARLVLKNFMDELLGLYVKNQNMVQLFINANESANEALRQTVSRTLIVIYHQLVAFLDDLQQQKILRNICNTNVLAYLILSPLLQLIRNERYQCSFFPNTMNDPVFVNNLCDEIIRKTFS